jgi:hypothetical protein
MVGRDRTDLLTEYITAVEQGHYRLPRNTPAFDSHKATTVDEVYAPGRWNSHLADDVAAFAIMHRAASRRQPPAEPQGIPKTDLVARTMRPLQMPKNSERQMGVVSREDDDWNPFIVS